MLRTTNKGRHGCFTYAASCHLGTDWPAFAISPQWLAGNHVWPTDPDTTMRPPLHHDAPVAIKLPADVTWMDHWKSINSVAAIAVSWLLRYACLNKGSRCVVARTRGTEALPIRMQKVDFMASFSASCICSRPRLTEVLCILPHILAINGVTTDMHALSNDISIESPHKTAEELRQNVWHVKVPPMTLCRRCHVLIWIDLQLCASRWDVPWALCRCRFGVFGVSQCPVENYTPACRLQGFWQSSNFRYVCSLCLKCLTILRTFLSRTWQTPG